MALERIVEQAKRGEVSAEQAASVAFAQGYLAIGSTVSLERRKPGVPLTAGNGESFLGWQPRITTERNGTVPLVRAGRVAETAIWSAYGGDVNEPFQRKQTQDSSIPDATQYDKGSYGWRFNKQTGLYELQGHSDLIEARDQLTPGEVVGHIDFVADDGSFVGIVDEPDHFVSTSPAGHETVASIPVRGSDVQALGDIANPAFYHYEPLAA